MPPVPKTACLTPEKLAAFLSGAVGETEAEEITAHIRECRNCEETTSHLQPDGDEFLRKVQRRIGNSSGQAPIDASVAGLIARLHQHPPQRDLETETFASGTQAGPSSGPPAPSTRIDFLAP